MSLPDTASTCTREDTSTFFFGVPVSALTVGQRGEAHPVLLIPSSPAPEHPCTTADVPLAARPPAVPAAAAARFERRRRALLTSHAAPRAPVRICFPELDKQMLLAKLTAAGADVRTDLQRRIQAFLSNRNRTLQDN